MSPLHLLLMTSGFLTPTGVSQPVVAAVADSSPPAVYRIAQNAPSSGGHVYVVQAKAPVGSSSSPKKAESRDIEEGGPWLGIQFGPVPKPLSAQLNVDDGIGQMVLNVAEGSPADSAGFQQYDVITAVDGSDATANIGDFLNVVRGFAPTQSHSFTIIRGGKSIQTNVVVGTRPTDLSSMKYKYESDAEELSGNRLFQRGGILQKDDQGNWTFQGLDQLHNMPDVWQYFSTPGANGIARIPGGNNTQLHVFNENGKTVQIRKDADGKIHVSKTETVNGQKSTTESEYNDDTAFEASDPDSYKMYKSQVNQPFHSFNFSFPDGSLQHLQSIPMPDMKDWSKTYEDLLKQWEGPLSTPKDMQSWMKQHQKFLNRNFGESSFPSAKAFVRPGGTSFETNADGSIRVLTRRGGDELVENYANAQALKSARPDLYKKYQKLLDGKGSSTGGE